MRLVMSSLSSLLTLLLLLFATPGEPRAWAEELRVTVRTIHASEQGHAISPALEPLRAQLKELFAGYGSFELISTHDLRLNTDTPERLPLPDRDHTTLVLGHRGWQQDGAKRLVRLHYALAGTSLATEVKASPGATFFQAGLFYKDGILIVAITTGAVPPTAGAPPGEDSPRP